MGKRRKKKNGKRNRRRRQRADERMADVALKGWRDVRQSALLMQKDYEGEFLAEHGGHLRDGVYMASEFPGGEVKMVGATISFGDASGDKWVADNLAQGVQDANLFIMTPDQYSAYHHEADRYTTEVVAEQEMRVPLKDSSPAFYIGMSMAGFDVPDDPRTEKHRIYPEEGAEHFDRVTAEGKHVPVPDPEKWPFETMWISFGEGVDLPSTAIQTRMKDDVFVRLGSPDVTLLGQLWTQTEKGPLIVEAMSFISANGGETPEIGTLWSVAYSPFVGWFHPYDLNPWICNAIHKHLLDFRTFVIEKEMTRRQVIEDDPPAPIIVTKAPPKPYYLVKLKSQTIHQAFGPAMPPRKKYELTYQFKVRGHERVRIKRGPLPLAPKDREILEQRKYTIYTINPMSQEHTRMLLERGIPVKRHNEWLAILTTWVKDYKKGPDDKPFVPSVRLT